ncbi:hypothetical protein SRABI112_04315 [Pseudomonas mediterranea]|uniref:Uncharacterized protein n=1 Tax=Pseudomonas mediterranea TaxID=183795 RepID=A0AAX2D7H9_9PSED|nr:hypothetical protein SRABI112_04315 [Pseudomonas mediterranea]SDU23112.1 hypothetical protein SAMN05216476_1029 [Pseudomonas mediterranea]
MVKSNLVGREISNSIFNAAPQKYLTPLAIKIKGDEFI